MKDRTITTISILAILAILAGSWFVWIDAPCGLWKFSSAGKIPTRCISHYTKG